jgi:hypothetical protein
MLTFCATFSFFQKTSITTRGCQEDTRAQFTKANSHAKWY